MNDIRDTLEERGTRYGAFCDHAEISQELKDVMHDTPNASLSGGRRPSA